MDGPHGRASMICKDPEGGRYRWALRKEGGRVLGRLRGFKTSPWKAGHMSPLLVSFCVKLRADSSSLSAHPVLTSVQGKGQGH